MSEEAEVKPGRGYTDMLVFLENAREEAREALGTLKRLKAGENLARYEWNRYDDAYDFYCSGCGCRRETVQTILLVPVERLSLCPDCRMSAEEKAARDKAVAAKKAANEELVVRKILKGNPDLLKKIVEEA